jgi:hypothetical protein
MNAGYPTKDYAIWPKDFSTTFQNHRTKLFIIDPEDKNSLEALRLMYPNGRATLYPSKVENKDFWVFLVPADE